ncbi:MAG: hypothetical protein QOI35_3815 [Cryptosporangiaceae bacterium]|nr:hypothetical protein [Cryptosporangiaceae bacterium]
MISDSHRPSPRPTSPHEGVTNRDKTVERGLRECHSEASAAVPLTRPLRTLVVNPSGVLGGAESWLMQAIGDSDRHDVEVILLDDGPLRGALIDLGIPVTVHPVGPKPADIARASVWIRRELRRRDPDVAVGNGVKAQAVLAPAALAAGVPAVWVKHDHSYDAKLAPWLARASTRVVATAQEVAEAARRSDTVVIEPPRPADPLPRVQAQARLADLGVPDSGLLRLVMLGRYVPYKGIDTAIRALARPEAANWELVAIGGDEPNRPNERQRLRALADVLGVSDRVHLCGYTPAASWLLSAADAVAVLTRPDGPRTPGREGFGMSALEAMVAGVPVLGIADGGPIARRIAPDQHGHRAGLTVPADDQAAVAMALAELADDETRHQLGRTGRERAVDHPDAREVATRFATVLAEAACRPGAGLAAGPAISIVSPVLNEAHNIDRLIGPIAAQLGPKDEYLLVDGGSTDGTRELIDAWAARDDRIVLVTTPGGTIANSRNRGIAAARNDFIACTDAGCDPGPDWVAGFRAAAAEAQSPGAPGLFVGVYRVGIREGSRFEQAMAAVSWPDPEELRRRTPLRRAYAKLFGRAFSPRRVDGRSVGFLKSAWAAAGGFPEYLRTAEDEAFGRAVIDAGTRSALTLDAQVTWHQRTSVQATFEQFRGYGRGGGTSRSRLLLGRDAIRTAAYAGAALAFVKGGRTGKLVAAAGAAAYLSVPVTRVVRRGQPASVLPLLPACILLKDVAKVIGTAEALLRIGRTAPQSRPATRPRPAVQSRPHRTVTRSVPTAPPVRPSSELPG